MKCKYYNQYGRFLDDLTTAGIVAEFSGADTEELYNNNLQTQPHSWHYRSKKIYYTHNSQGYRAPEFDTVDWNNSIVVFGCSNVYGVGLADDETVCYHLEQLTNKPVINMGIGGSSIPFSVFNQIALHERQVKPLAVVNMWTSATRMLHFSQSNTLSIGAWTLTQAPRFRQMFLSWAADDANPEGHAWMYRRMCRALWQDTKHYECTYFCDLPFDIEKVPRIDLARDLQHPGTQSMQIAAKKIAEGLKL